MAARLRKTHQDDGKYFVYELLNQDGDVFYVGKGSGRRAHVSMKQRAASEFRVVKRFRSEADAYMFEKDHIAKFDCLINKCAGGNGSKAAKIRKPKWLCEIEDVGTRVYAARLLMKYPQMIAPSKVDMIRQVSHG